MEALVQGTCLLGVTHGTVCELLGVVLKDVTTVKHMPFVDAIAGVTFEITAAVERHACEIVRQERAAYVLPVVSRWTVGGLLL